MNLPMISVIIPIYNAEVYLRRCLDSVICQSYTNIEMILINDGSTDRSGKICDEYAAHDKRIKAIHVKNGGVSAARNLGLNISQGEYVCFIDADDAVDVNYIQYLYSLITTYGAELSVCSVIRVRGKKGETHIEKENKKHQEKIFTGNEALKSMIYKKELTGYSIAKLMKRELIGNIRFEEKLKVAEDFVFVFDVLKGAGRVVYGNNPLYTYFQNVGSCMQDKDWQKYQITWNMLVNPNGKYNKLDGELKSAFTNYLFIGALGFYSQIDVGNENVDFIEDLIEYVKENRRTVLTNKEGKIVHRILAFLCCLSARGGCKVCKMAVRLNRTFHIQIKKAV